MAKPRSKEPPLYPPPKVGDRVLVSLRGGKEIIGKLEQVKKYKNKRGRITTEHKVKGTWYKLPVCYAPTPSEIRKACEKSPSRVPAERANQSIGGIRCYSSSDFMHGGFTHKEGFE